jgi:hypothetical protein
VRGMPSNRHPPKPASVHAIPTLAYGYSHQPTHHLQPTLPPQQSCCAPLSCLLPHRHSTRVRGWLVSVSLCAAAPDGIQVRALAWPICGDFILDDDRFFHSNPSYSTFFAPSFLCFLFPFVSSAYLASILPYRSLTSHRCGPAHLISLSLFACG